MSPQNNGVARRFIAAFAALLLVAVGGVALRVYTTAASPSVPQLTGAPGEPPLAASAIVTIEKLGLGLSHASSPTVSAASAIRAALGSWPLHGAPGSVRGIALATVSDPADRSYMSMTGHTYWVISLMPGDGMTPSDNGRQLRVGFIYEFIDATSGRLIDTRIGGDEVPATR